ncbi:hypothetical protein UFOVP39_28 [uncultured Caudovirales phage]|uniref:Uncharacterized protein n=1 Tax=uncultured Caudovirales phage TaxID=2100421 RepID=A0A6J5T791_9CAUD|nr:hypothetical protein UFOVP39_28 [uncultured Caudovirales phage]
MTGWRKRTIMEMALEALTNSIAVRNGEGGTRLVSPLEENAIFRNKAQKAVIEITNMTKDLYKKDKDVPCGKNTTK